MKGSRSTMVYDNPRLIILLSGKRKSGKDFIATKLLSEFASADVAILHLSGPLKSDYARIHGLDTARLMDDSSYKEDHRLKMIAWGESIRHKTPAYFCQRAILEAKAWRYPIWIVTDARRQSDLNFFRNSYRQALRSIRVSASKEVRTRRGWVHTVGVDDAESECGLDDVTQWNFDLPNNGDIESEVAWKKLVTELHSTTMF